MAINYTLDNRLDVLGQFLNEYQRWYADILQSKIFNAEPPQDPQGFLKWLEGIPLEAINVDGNYAKQAQQIKAQREALIKAGLSLSEPPQDKDFKEFSGLFHDFTAALQVFCQSVILEEWGVDVLTGLKNNLIVMADLTIEMERLSREGAPFCLGLARIDDFETIEKAGDEQQTTTVIEKVAGLIQKSLRSYDDAYRVGRDHFIMCLKQSDIIGGQKALERLRDIMEEKEEHYEINGEQKLISLSCCVAAPLPDDDVEDLIDNLYVDLDEQIKDQGAVLTYQEMSPLQRFIQKEKD